MKTLKYIFSRRTEKEKTKRKEKEEKNGSSKFTVIYMSFYLLTDWIEKNSKLTLLEALYKPGLQFLLQIALLHTSQWEKKPHHSGSEAS